MNSRNRRTPADIRRARASRGFDRRMAPVARTASPVRRTSPVPRTSPRSVEARRAEARREAMRMARIRRRVAKENEDEALEETLDLEEEEKEARVRRMQARRARASRTPSKRQRVSKIDALTLRLDRIARILEKQAGEDPLQGGTQDLSRGLDDSPRPKEINISDVDEQPVTVDEALSEEPNNGEIINTKPVSSRVRPIRMANRGAGAGSDLSLF